MLTTHVAVRALARLAVVATIVAGAVVGFAPEAHAGTCWDTGCDGQDPQATGCSADAYTLTSVPIAVDTPFGRVDMGTMDVRFSPSCQAQWTRLYVPANACYAGYRAICPGDGGFTWRWAQGSYGDAAVGMSFIGDPGAGDTYSWTAMVGAAYAQVWSHACAHVTNYGPWTDATFCVDTIA